MASREEIFPQTACCEICGVALGDEVVVQEFADGSLVRLCTECAAGADLGRGVKDGPRDSEIAWPEAPPVAAPASAAESDPLEKTRELLMPVVDLIALQREMQAALERLAASLERFAAEMITESQDKTAVESRLQVLEQELDKTRKQLSEGESLLNAAGAGPSASPTAASSGSTGPDSSLPATETVGATAGAAAAVVGGAGQTTESTPAKTLPEIEPPIAWPGSTPVPTFAGADTQVTPAATAAPAAPPAPPAPSAPPATNQAQEQVEGQGPQFRIDEVQAAQRYFNESSFTNRVRDVRRSLGKPKANVSRFPGPEPLALVTVTWDIVWYQYLVDLRRDFSTTAERVSLYREGMDLDELAYDYRDKNAVINDDGRLDASELEVKLLSDPSALITEMNSEETKLLDDATEEVWDHKISPEFKWDD